VIVVPSRITIKVSDELGAHDFVVSFAFLDSGVAEMFGRLDAFKPSGSIQADETM
jgi:hypothetical protein